MYFKNKYNEEILFVEYYSRVAEDTLVKRNTSMWECLPITKCEKCVFNPTYVTRRTSTRPVATLSQLSSCSTSTKINLSRCDPFTVKSSAKPIHDPAC